MKTLILGLGNPVFIDERVGLDVARGLYVLVDRPDVDIIEAPIDGLNVLELVAGYDKVVVVDCIRTGQGDVGELKRLGFDDLKLTPRRMSGGGTEYRLTFESGESDKVAPPREISIYAIEVGRGASEGEAAEKASEAVPRLVAQIAREEFGQRTLGADLL